MRESRLSSSQAGTRLGRPGAIGGIAFTVLSIASVVIAPQPPAFDDNISKIRSYLLDNHAALSVSVLLTSAAALCLMLFVAMVHQRIALAEGGAGFLASAFLVPATVVAAMGLLGSLFQSALVERVVPAADDSTLRAVYGIGQTIFYDGPSLAIIVALCAAAAATLRYDIFGRTTAWVALASAGLGVADVGSVASKTDSVAALGLIGFLMANIWFVWVSVGVLRERGVDTAPPALVGQGSPT